MAAKQDSNSRPRKNRTQQDNKPQKERFPLPFEACFLHNLFGVGVLRQLLLGLAPPFCAVCGQAASAAGQSAQGRRAGKSVPERDPKVTTRNIHTRARPRTEAACQVAARPPHQAPHRNAIPSHSPERRAKPRAETPYQATAPKHRTKPHPGTSYQATAPKRHAKPRAGMPYRNTSSKRCTAFAKPQTGRFSPKFDKK